MNWSVTFVSDHFVIYTRIESADDNEDVLEKLATEKLLDNGIDIKSVRIIDIECEEVE